LIDAKVDGLYEVDATAVEEDKGPCVDLQDPGAGHLATQGRARFFAFPSLCQPTVLKAAIPLRSPAIETGMRAIRESRRDVNLKPPLPDEAAELP
jgi:hypothetical protein